MVLRAGHDRFGKRGLVERPTARGGRVPIADAAVGFTNRNLVKLIELVDALAIDNLDAMLLAAGEMAVIVALAEIQLSTEKIPPYSPLRRAIITARSDGGSSRLVIASTRQRELPVAYEGDV